MSLKKQNYLFSIDENCIQLIMMIDISKKRNICVYPQKNKV